ncbi:MAG TPA: hypothetical protein VMD51_12290 [Mycobacterium sp.]|nr:hypothetical protein [Mycobacterium sp.]
MIAAIAVLAGATAVGLGLLGIGLIGMARHPAGTPEPVSSTPAAPRTTQTSPSALTVAMREWESRAGDHFTESARALDQVSQAAERGEVAGVRMGCQRLHDTNAVGLQADLPTPDPALTAELQRMIDDVNTAAHACLRFADSRNDDDATTYQTYLARAIDHLTAAKQILNEDLGKG